MMIKVKINQSGKPYTTITKRIYILFPIHKWKIELRMLAKKDDGLHIYLSPYSRLAEKIICVLFIQIVSYSIGYFLLWFLKKKAMFTKITNGHIEVIRSKVLMKPSWCIRSWTFVSHISADMSLLSKPQTVPCFHHVGRHCGEQEQQYCVFLLFVIVWLVLVQCCITLPCPEMNLWWMTTVQVFD